MKRALVLGGGGPIGVEWEAGLVRGLVESGFPIDEVDAIVGTSAGALVGTYLGHKRVLRPFEERTTDARTENAVTGTLALLGPDRIDVQVFAEIYRVWGAIERTTPADAQRVGELVRRLDRSHESVWIAQARASMLDPGWPSRRLLVVAVDVDSGERRVFERDAGVPLDRVLAASMAVPGLFPAVEIEGRLYMDGQVWSSTSADLLVAERPEQVLIAMPTNAATGRSIGPHAERMLEQEVAALRAVGCDVHVATPSSEDVQRMGSNLMDYGRLADAHAVGFDAGCAWAAELRASGP